MFAFNWSKGTHRNQTYFKDTKQTFSTSRVPEKYVQHITVQYFHEYLTPRTYPTQDSTKTKQKNTVEHANTSNDNLPTYVLAVA